MWPLYAWAKRPARYVLDRARAAAEDYLAHFPPQQRGAILLGPLASVYGKEDGGVDTAVWLAGSKDDQAQLQISIAHQTIEALRQTGLLNDIIETKEGLVIYPSQSDLDGFNSEDI